MLHEALAGSSTERAGQCTECILRNLASIIARGVRQGATLPDAETLLDRVVAPVIYRILFTKTPPTTQYAAGLLRQCLDGQGVKGLEFPRVMVVISDEEARGFLFSYDKLFGLKPPSANDLKRKADGEETGVDRTRRLFYVTCSRAEESLAIVCYTDDPDALVSSVIGRGWFDATEASRLV